MSNRYEYRPMIHAADQSLHHYVEDLEKAAWYINRELQRRRKENDKENH